MSPLYRRWLEGRPERKIIEVLTSPPPSPSGAFRPLHSWVTFHVAPAGTNLEFEASGEIKIMKIRGVFGY